MGVKQNGKRLEDVEVATWTVTRTPEEFVFRMRQALESPLVQIKLHKWIDLIFGYKSQGKEATTH
jgi:hypothetical protein